MPIAVPSIDTERTQVRTGSVTEKDPGPSRPEYGRRRGLRALAATLPRIAAPAARQRGFAETGILTDWEAIIGPELAADTQPERLAFPREANLGATLHLRAAPGVALELQHLEPQIIERINRFFGYRAVVRLKMVQAPLAAVRGPRRPQPRRLTPAEEKALETSVEGIGEDRLKQALIRLGKAIGSRTPPAGDV